MFVNGLGASFLQLSEKCFYFDLFRKSCVIHTILTLIIEAQLVSLAPTTCLFPQGVTAPRADLNQHEICAHVYY